MGRAGKLAGLEVENTPEDSDLIGHNLEHLELRDSNDLITPMAAWLALGQGGTITGAKHAIYKESNRIVKTAELLSRFGIESKITDDGLIVAGEQMPNRPEGIIETYGDHRIQMTAILLASICGGAVEGANLHNVAWPSFVEQLRNRGLQVEN